MCDIYKRDSRDSVWGSSILMTGRSNKNILIYLMKYHLLTYKYQQLVESLFFLKSKKKFYFVTRVTYFEGVFLQKFLENLDSIAKNSQCFI